MPSIIKHIIGHFWIEDRQAGNGRLVMGVQVMGVQAMDVQAIGGQATGVHRR